MLLDPLIRIWRDNKSRTSVYDADNTLEEVGRSTISALGDHAPRRHARGKTELRPTWGMRLGVPLIASAVLYALGSEVLFGYLPLIGLPANAPYWAGVLAWAAILWTALQLNVFQKVIYDDETLRCEGLHLSAQTRNLSGLVDMAVHPKQSALVLTFADQPHLYLPKFISMRHQFLDALDAIIEQNLAAGHIPTAEPSGQVPDLRDQ